MKVLILSVDPWCHNNSFGNTYSNIFGRIENMEIAHVYLLDGLPDKEKNVVSYYQIPESKVIKSVFKPHCYKYSVGKKVLPITREAKVAIASSEDNKKKSVYNRLLDFGKQHHWHVMFAAREAAWRIGNINYEGLFSFIEQFNPDLFLLAYYYVYNSNHIAQRIAARFDVPMVTVMMMDHYSLKRVSWNPFFWLDRFAKRSVIRKLASRSELFLVISKKLKEELECALHVPCRILYKSPDEDRAYEEYKAGGECIKYLFTGNIYANRWKTLTMLVNELKKQGGGKLDIYTATPISKDIDNALNVDGVSKIHAPVSQETIIELQNKADVLVHVEAFDKYNKMLVRCAISTKIMDYLSVGRCILSIGPSDIASMEYLSENDLALSAGNQNQLAEIIKRINEDRSIIGRYAEKGRNYSTRTLSSSKMRRALYNDLQQVIDNYKTRGEK